MFAYTVKFNVVDVVNIYMLFHLVYRLHSMLSFSLQIEMYYSFESIFNLAIT